MHLADIGTIRNEISAELRLAKDEHRLLWAENILQPMG
jgi:hypothetical protein